MGKLPSGIKDLLTVAAVLGLLLGGLFAYTGVWPPAVVVESGSMMHRDSEVSYGRFGTIDPGDLVLVKRVDGPGDVVTWAEQGRERYGAPGDVIVYHRNGDPADTPIIHRAMAWVTVDGEGSSARYLVRWHPESPCPNTGAPPQDGRHCVWGRDGITSPDLGVQNYRPERAGFITKGDNPATNREADQEGAISTVVVPEWVLGKARGEVPWLGLVKLAMSPFPNQPDAPATWTRVNNAAAPNDLWVMLVVSVAAVVAGPVALEAVGRGVSRTRKGS